MIGYSDTVVGFKRLSKRPLEYNSVFTTKSDAINYVENDPTAYEGQIISVNDSGNEGIYIIVKSGNLLKLATVAEVRSNSYIELDNVSSSITITHGMNKIPEVNVLDSELNKVYVDINYDDLNNVTLSWNGTLSGRVYLI